MGLLDQIIAHKKSELPELRKTRLPAPPSEIPAFLGRRLGGPLRLLCEIKKRSPSAGELSHALSVEERARVYEECGASAISVLCDSKFFDGHYEDLVRARRGSKLPLLCKEFIIDECQLDAARAFGASAALLIVRCIEGNRLETLIDAAEERGLVPFVEVFTHEECRRALDAGAKMIGVNARDLDTLAMNADLAGQILEAIPQGLVAAHLSGVKSPDDIVSLRKARADAALIGEVLMRQDDQSDVLRQLVDAARLT
jgi:indole-3-glycerol phosphate synthase